MKRASYLKQFLPVTLMEQKKKEANALMKSLGKGVPAWGSLVIKKQLLAAEHK